MAKESEKTESILRAAEGLGSSGISLLVGLGLWGAIAILGVLGLLFIILNDGYIYSKEDCVKLEEVDGRIFKVNSCTDQVSEINLNK